MRFQKILSCLFFLFVSGCAGQRGGPVDYVLDSKVYTAQSKAERLLRYYEVQALIVRLIAESGGSSADRNAMAAQNIAATAELNGLINCMLNGSTTDLTDEPPRADAHTPNQTIALKYCSFFESRVLTYEEQVLLMVRQAARYDTDAKLIETLVTGNIAVNFPAVVGDIVQLAGRIIKDGLVYSAFKADALELQNLVSQKQCTTVGTLPCDMTSIDRLGIESASASELRQRLEAARAAQGAPTILVWHFQEVGAYMVAACTALNGDKQIVVSGATAATPTCASNIPFQSPPSKQANAG